MIDLLHLSVHVPCILGPSYTIPDSHRSDILQFQGEFSTQITII
jgi:hypothetical protein